MFIFAGHEIETDSEGYLKDTTQWSEPLAEKIAASELSLPMYVGMTDEEIQYVIDALNAY